jgi:Putative MetA-pathway of phenol degradation
VIANPLHSIRETVLQTLHKLIHRAGLAIALGISKTNVSSVALIALVWLLLLANSARSQETEPTTAIVTDRPDVTESSIVVPKSSLQFENGITWTTDHSNQSVDFSETLVRLGISRRTELRLVIPNYLKTVTDSNVSGFDDIAVGAKQQLGPLWGHFDLAVIAALSLPTGAREISSHGFDPFIKFPWSRDLGKRWSLSGMQSFFGNTKAGRRNLVWELTLMVEKEISGRWSAFGEYAGDFAQKGSSKQIMHFGTAYRITPKQQIDFHLGFRVSPAAPQHFVAVGYSIRLDGHPRRQPSVE